MIKSPLILATEICLEALKDLRERDREGNEDADNGSDDPNWICRIQTTELLVFFIFLPFFFLFFFCVK
jgi:hypothetical protein